MKTETIAKSDMEAACPEITSADVAAFLKSAVADLSVKSGEYCTISAEATCHLSGKIGIQYRAYVAKIGYSDEFPTMEEAMADRLSKLSGDDAIREKREKAALLLRQAEELEQRRAAK